MNRNGGVGGNAHRTSRSPLGLLSLGESMNEKGGYDSGKGEKGSKERD